MKRLGYLYSVFSEVALQRIAAYIESAQNCKDVNAPGYSNTMWQALICSHRNQNGGGQSVKLRTQLSGFLLQLLPLPRMGY